MYPNVNILSKVLNHQIKVLPDTSRIVEREDILGNKIGEIIFENKTSSLEVLNTIDIEIINSNSFDFIIEESFIQYPFNYSNFQLQTLDIYLDVPKNKDLIRAWIEETYNYRPINTVELILELNRFVFNKIRYVKRLEPGVQNPIETINSSSGSCRDSSWLLISCFRVLKIASRFVSGYLADLNYDNPENDHVDLHAWVEVFLPGAGWLGLDPTTGLLTTSNYIAVYKSSSYEKTGPIEGKSEKTDVIFSFNTKLERL